MTINAILILFSELAILWWLFAWLYYDYRLAILRFKLFSVRDSLFLYAAEGKISFEEPAYIMTRTTINGALRFAHRLTLGKLLITYIWLRINTPKAGAKYHSELNKSIHNLSYEQQKLIMNAHLNLHYAVLSHVFHVSIFLLPLTLFLKIGFRFHLWHCHRLSKRTRTEMEPIDAYAFDLGTQVNAA
jgi:hypothetical protein